MLQITFTEFKETVLKRRDFNGPVRGRLRRRMGLLGIGTALGTLATLIGVRLYEDGLTPLGPVWGTGVENRSAVDRAGAESESPEVEALRAALEIAAMERMVLADQVTRLEEELSQLALLNELNVPRSRPASGPENLSGEPSVGAEGGRQEPGLDNAQREKEPGFDDAALLVTDVDPQDVARLRDRWERLEMDKLYLTDQALRQGWFSSPRHRMERLRLQMNVRDELGEEDYDLFLFATGQGNRVVAREVLDGSPAGDAGLKPGDTILRYDGVQVFKPGELLLATASGQPGEQVRVEVLRDGEPVAFYVSRGPLGVLLEPESRAP